MQVTTQEELIICINPMDPGPGYLNHLLYWSFVTTSPVPSWGGNCPMAVSSSEVEMQVLSCMQ